MGRAHGANRNRARLGRAAQTVHRAAPEKPAHGPAGGSGRNGAFAERHRNRTHYHRTGGGGNIASGARPGGFTWLRRGLGAGVGSLRHGGSLSVALAIAVACICRLCAVQRIERFQAAEYRPDSHGPGVHAAGAETRELGDIAFARSDTVSQRADPGRFRAPAGFSHCRFHHLAQLLESRHHAADRITRGQRKPRGGGRARLRGWGQPRRRAAGVHFHRAVRAGGATPAARQSSLPGGGSRADPALPATAGAPHRCGRGRSRSQGPGGAYRLQCRAGDRLPAVLRPHRAAHGEGAARPARGGRSVNAAQISRPAGVRFARRCAVERVTRNSAHGGTPGEDVQNGHRGAEGQQGGGSQEHPSHGRAPQRIPKRHPGLCGGAHQKRTVDRGEQAGAGNHALREQSRTCGRYHSSEPGGPHKIQNQGKHQLLGGRKRSARQACGDRL